MKRGVVLPATAAGWCLLLAFLGTLILGIWPVIGWVNHQEMWWGLPPILVWSYGIVLVSCGVMAWANRVVERDDDQ